ncbi:MAG: hypothetical protein JJU15_20165 [Pararhodobacter sp.]|nr:hypothetical protein [Pararhodobacter sp.]
MNTPKTPPHPVGRRAETPPAKAGGDTTGSARDKRLKAALKANLARRKAQARARAAGTDTEGAPEHG